MNAIFTIVVLSFVVTVLGVVAYSLFAMSPFARHTDKFRDPLTGSWLGEGPLD
ncbi:MAG TPA: hypothetical protein VG652_08275 [Gaiellaceae bacterium]|nr:hypothetical protein [Gaiellaceae bacterium]